MSNLVEALHSLAEDLEDEGHSLAGRLRDLVDRVKADFGHLIGGSKDELDTFVGRVVATLAPELDDLRAQIVTEIVTELEKARAEAKVVLDNLQLAATAVQAGTAAPAAQD
jgi:hypothetical protein